MRSAFFGDLHVHTARSFDAVIEGTRATPAEAYAFAQGAPLSIPPFDEGKVASRTVRIDRPLDFMAVTDHAEFFGETQLCNSKDSPGFGLPGCTSPRGGDEEDFDKTSFPISLTHAKPTRTESLCLENDKGENICAKASRDIWREMQREAERAYDRTSTCSFTTFVGYEYSGAPMGSNLHRNIIFRNGSVPEAPISYIEEPVPGDMLLRLSQSCKVEPHQCDFVSIPHNSNLSNGKMFPPMAGTREEARELAQLRARSEPIIELVQHKGYSECANGLGPLIGEPDELCDFEQVRGLDGGIELDMSQVEAIFGFSLPEPTDCENPESNNVRAFGTANKGCISAYDFARGALLRGLEEEKRVGSNPYQFGFIGSTDTHLGTAGNVKESSWPGHVGYETSLQGRLSLGFMPTNRLGNPGGLAGVWAEENSRDSLFNAFKRKEVFATSGPRIRPRFFAAPDFSSALCRDPGRVAKAYSTGVPMGSDLVKTGSNKGLKFFALALADNADWSMPLQKIQIIKGWLDDAGSQRYKVFDVAIAGDAKGANELCTVFEDPEFSPDQFSYYYMRVVEMPTLRWDAQQCAEQGEKAPAACAEAEKQVIQEMAWTSPIWYRPE